MQSLEDFAQEMSRHQKARRVTATELAGRAGLTDQSVRAMLHGHAAPRLTNAMALADALGLELVLVPKAVAQEMRASAEPPQARTVVSDIERTLGRLPDIRSEAVRRAAELSEGTRSEAARRAAEPPSTPRRSRGPKGQP